MGHRRRAFTLIELLIVIAIIAILAVIAVPNYLESQIRAKVSRAHADMRTIAGALEDYAVEWGCYPLNDGAYNAVPFELTTPVAYLATSALVDPFAIGVRQTSSMSACTSPYYTYTKTVTFRQAAESQEAGRACPNEAIDYGTYNKGAFQKYGQWRLVSLGPDKVYLDPTYPHITRGSDIPYDPTNGTLSFGNILRTQKGAPVM